MNSRDKNDGLHFFNKNIGVVTANDVILTKSRNQETIAIQNIEKIELVKKRDYILNLILFAFSLAILIYSYFYINHNQIIKTTIFLTGILILSFSYIFTKTNYILKIVDLNRKIHTLKTSKKNRKEIKKFYFTISKKLNSNKN